MRLVDYQTAIVCAAAGLLLAAGCGPNTGSGEPVDHQTTQQRLQENATTITERVNESIRFIQESKLVVDSYNDLSGRNCPEGSGDCRSRRTEPEVTRYTNETSEAALKWLEKRVFTKENVEQRTRTSITYRVRGKSVCQRDDFTYEEPCPPDNRNCEPQESYDKQAHQECIGDVDAVEGRIRVTQPRTGDLEFDVFVGPERYNPVTIELFDDQIAAEADLADIRKSAVHMDKATGTETADYLPKTMEGRIRGELAKVGPEKMRFQAIIQQAVTVAGGDYDISLGRSRPVLGVTVDGRAKRLSATADFGTIDAGFPWTFYTGSASHGGSGSSGETKVQNRVHLDGFTTEVVLDGSQEILSFSNVGLGDATSWWKMDGNKVLAADLNPNAGRKFSGSVSSSKKGGIEVQLSPKVHAEADLNFGRINSKLDGYFEQWMLDDTISVDFSGTQPTFRTDWWNYFEIVSGRLEANSETPDLNATIESGECVQYEEPNSGSYFHPVRGYHGGSCTY